MFLFHIWMHNSENKVFFYDVVEGATVVTFLGAIILKFRKRSFRDHFRKAAKITSAWKFPGQTEESVDMQKKRDQFLARCAEYNLSTREIEVTELLDKGKLVKEIADELNISFETVKSHLQHIYVKIEVDSGKLALNKLNS